MMLSLLKNVNPEPCLEYNHEQTGSNLDIWKKNEKGANGVEESHRLEGT